MNPILPLNEYVPDPEAHVFGDRVYLYGSHDAAHSNRFCIQNYTVYSADIHDLSAWTHHGVSYRKSQDPHSKNGRPVDFYAPDCVRGNDGRYYLYYCAMGPNTENFGPVSVAVSDHPEGPFDYFGDVRYEDGTIMRDFLTNDPAVINDHGTIWLYYGWGLGRDFRNPLLKPVYNYVLSRIGHRSLNEIQSVHPSVLSCACVQLKEDMLTIAEAPHAVLDSKTTAAKNSPLYDHPFYEAPCIRKFNALYYLIYSSGENNELAYAISRYPDHGFVYAGVLISNSDLGYEGNTEPKNNSGTIHGCVEYINGAYYVFYHRCTNNTDFSRQACMERIEMDENGYFRQAEMTTSSIVDELSAEGIYPAGYACHLITPKPVRPGVGAQQEKPRITESQGHLILADLDKGCKAEFRYFDLSHTEKLIVHFHGAALIQVNGIRLNEHHEVSLPRVHHSTITIEICEGKCDIESLEFVKGE